MAEFFNNLFNSIFTPGPTPSLIIATNVSFAGLQVVFLALLIATYSIHFIVLSILSAGLWWAINWFVAELEASKEAEGDGSRPRDVRRERGEKRQEDSGTETEAGEDMSQGREMKRNTGAALSPQSVDEAFRKRRSSGEASAGDLSTDSEWDKVEDEGDVER